MAVRLHCGGSSSVTEEVGKAGSGVRGMGVSAPFSCWKW